MLPQMSQRRNLSRILINPEILIRSNQSVEITVSVIIFKTIEFAEEVVIRKAT